MAERLQIAVNGRFLSQQTTGVQRMAREFTRALDGLLAEGTLPDVDVRLIVHPSAQFRDLALKAIEIETVDGASGHAWEQFLLPRHVKSGWLLNLGNTAPVISLMNRQHVAVVLHDISYRLFPEAYAKSYRLSHRIMNLALMRRANVIITVAETERRMIERYYPRAADRILVVPNGGWSDGSRRARTHGTSIERYGLYVGSLSKRKNVEGVIATAIRMARSHKLNFMVVGAPSPILRRIELELPDDVRSFINFCGQIEDVQNLRALYQGAAFLLFPSFYEASALPPMEAMGQCCPVIASDIPSMVERCGDAAIYCDPSSLSSIEAEALRILDEPQFAQGLADRGLVRAARYTWRAQALAIVEALRASPNS